jgi:hypothetical protein
MCWNEGCSEKYSYSHRDECQFKNQPALRKMEIQTAMDLDPGEFDDQSPIFCMLEGPLPMSNFIYAPIRLAGVKYVQVLIQWLAFPLSLQHWLPS